MEKSGWIKWEGGECPVDDETGIQVMFRDQTTYSSTTGGFRWKHIGAPGDIVAYRVAEYGEYDPPVATSGTTVVDVGEPVPEYTGGSSSYYKVDVSNLVSAGDPYTVECQDVIEALDMSFSEGNIFKAIWRICAAKKGKAKKGYEDSVYDLEKIIFFAQRELQIEKMKRGQ